MNIDEPKAELAQIIARATEIDARLAALDQLSDCPDCPKCVAYREQLALLQELLGMSVALTGKAQSGLDDRLKQTEELVKKLSKNTDYVAMLRGGGVYGMH